MAKETFAFQKDYWFSNNGKSDVIDSFNPEPELRRYEKLSKIFDRINNTEHTYIKSNDEKYIDYFKRRFKEKTKIPHGKTRTK